MGQTRDTSRVQWSLAGQDGIDRAPVRIDCADPHAFRSRGTRWTFGDVIVSDTIHTACTVSSVETGGVDDRDRVSAIFVLSGGYDIVDADRELSLGKGRAGWLSVRRQVSGTSVQTSRVVRVAVPRESLGGAEQGHRSLGRFDEALMLTAPTLAFVLGLMGRADEPGFGVDGGTDGDVGNGHPAVRALSQLVSALFREQSGRVEARALPAAGLWAAALALIDREFRDPLLDPASLAVRLHISLRQLQRAFAQNRSTISDAIRDRRAESAAALLADTGSNVGLPLGGVAAASGFSSTKEMRFALRTRHGMTPREFRSASATSMLAPTAVPSAVVAPPAAVVPTASPVRVAVTVS
ncbi:AraC family transcriptional regulator [Subtercola boreus]|uniref:AraC family transcriptional regulator n=1 Tax=Subtercola boreus TaxID=120213 RepID=UPI001473A2DE|nr:AraC family transcriptional regulator [Subtercola boreus]